MCLLQTISNLRVYNRQTIYLFEKTIYLFEKTIYLFENRYFSGNLNNSRNYKFRLVNFSYNLNAFWGSIYKHCACFIFPCIIVVCFSLGVEDINYNVQHKYLHFLIYCTGMWKQTSFKVLSCCSVARISLFTR